jgi:hypothetical protein
MPARSAVLSQEGIDSYDRGVVEASVVGGEALDAFHDLSLEIADHDSGGGHFIARVFGRHVIESVNGIPEMPHEFVHMFDPLCDSGNAWVGKLG